MIRKALLLAGIFALVPLTVSANSLAVTAAAAMGSSNSSNCGVAGAGCGLEVNYTGAPSLAFVQSNHMSNETAVRVQFTIDPGMASNPLFDMDPGGRVRILNIFESFSLPDGVQVILFLKRSLDDASWRLACWVWNNPVNTFTFGGEGYLTGLTPALGSATIVTFEWGAGAGDGFVRATRTLEGPGQTTYTIFERTNLNNSGRTLNTLRAGSISTNEVGNPEGVVYFDEFVISRL